ncbi:DUF2859 domain-containing protein [Klebsiella pneumoniae]|nr:DUF2859 domain-containing protein [Klebsiella pneumoniae]
MPVWQCARRAERYCRFGREPAAPYFDGINNQPNEFESPNPPEAAVLPAAPASLASVLPISTPELTPGSVEARRLGLPRDAADIFVG